MNHIGASEKNAHVPTYDEVKRIKDGTAVKQNK